MGAVSSIWREASVESLVHAGSAVHPRIPSTTQLCLQAPRQPKKHPGLQACSCQAGVQAWKDDKEGDEPHPPVAPAQCPDSRGRSYSEMQGVRNPSGPQ